jgi:hypothetical protein
MNDETVLLNDLSLYGLRRVHVIRMGQPVDMERWLMLMTEDEVCSLQRMEYEDKGMGVWHLRLWWHYKGPVTGSQPGILWHLSKGERVSECVRRGAELHLAFFERWPVKAMIGKLPNGSRPVELDEGIEITLERAEREMGECLFLFAVPREALRETMEPVDVGRN